jgi:hypothetical protein
MALEWSHEEMTVINRMEQALERLRRQSRRARRVAVDRRLAVVQNQLQQVKHKGRRRGPRWTPVHAFRDKIDPRSGGYSKTKISAG